MTASDLAPLRGLIAEWQKEATDEDDEDYATALAHCADQLSVVLSSLQVTEEEDVTRNVEAVLTPGDQLPHRPTEGNS
jgi:hypothetical protein